MSLLPSQHSAAKAIIIALITAVYFLAGKIGLGFASLNESPSPVWAPAGMAIALLLMFGISTWPAILAKVAASVPGTSATTVRWRSSRRWRA